MSSVERVARCDECDGTAPFSNQPTGPWAWEEKPKASPSQPAPFYPADSAPPKRTTAVEALRRKEAEEAEEAEQDRLRKLVEAVDDNAAVLPITPNGNGATVSLGGAW